MSSENKDKFKLSVDPTNIELQSFIGKTTDTLTNINAIKVSHIEWFSRFIEDSRHIKEKLKELWINEIWIDHKEFQKDVDTLRNYCLEMTHPSWEPLTISEIIGDYNQCVKIQSHITQIFKRLELKIIACDKSWFISNRSVMVFDGLDFIENIFTFISRIKYQVLDIAQLISNNDRKILTDEFNKELKKQKELLKIICLSSL